MVLVSGACCLLPGLAQLLLRQGPLATLHSPSDTPSSTTHHPTPHRRLLWPSLATLQTPSTLPPSPWTIQPTAGLVSAS